MKILNKIVNSKTFIALIVLSPVITVAFLMTFFINIFN